MNRCLSFAWLGYVGIGGSAHKGRREIKCPKRKAWIVLCLYEASSCMTSFLAGTLVGFNKTRHSDGLGHGGGRWCHGSDRRLKQSLRGKPVRWVKLWCVVALQCTKRRAVLRRTRLFGSPPC